MPAPTTAAEVSRALSGLTERLYAHVRAYSAAETLAVNLRADADLAYAKAYLKFGGTIPEREEQANAEVSVLEREACIAESVVRVMKMKLSAIKIDIDAHRTYGATVRAELQTLGYDPSP